MIILIFLLLIALGTYTLWDPFRQQAAQAQQTDLLASRGAAIFAQYCRPCHGDDGQGRIGPPLNPAYRAQQHLTDLTNSANLDQNQLFVMDTIMCGRVGTLMPTWGQSQGGALSDEQIRDLLTLITIDPKDSTGADAWQRYVVPDSEAANKIATPLPIQDITSGPLTGQTQSVCGQKVAGTVVATPPPTPGAPSTTLSQAMTDNAFASNVFTIPANQTVTMSVTNRGAALHNWHVLDVKDATGKDIVAPAPPAPGLTAGTTASITFSVNTPGTYHFQCDFHPTEMFGVLYVAGPGGTVPATSSVATTTAGIAVAGTSTPSAGATSAAATQAPANLGAPNPASGTGIQNPASATSTTGPSANPGQSTGGGAVPVP